MGRSFKGIERFYPPDVFLDAHKAGELVLGISGSKPYSIAADQLKSAKQLLRDRVLQVDSLQKLEPLIKVVADLESAVRGGAVLQLSLPGVPGRGNSNAVA